MTALDARMRKFRIAPSMIFGARRFDEYLLRYAFQEKKGLKRGVSSPHHVA